MMSSTVNTAAASSDAKSPSIRRGSRRQARVDAGSDDDEDEDFTVEANDDTKDTITVFTHVRDKIIPVHCGFGTQQVLWLGHVAIARFGEEDGSQGWKELGVPTRVVNDDKRELKLTDIVCEVLRNRSHVYISTSLGG